MSASQTKPCKRGHIAERNKNGRCMECRRENERKYRARNPEKKLESNRRAGLKRSAKTYGIPEPTRPMPDLCECCGSHRGDKGLHRDHDHNTGLFRGWACHKCNRLLGLLGDNYDALRLRVRQLTAYLNMADLT
jgi:hypothetical protein